MIPARGIPNPYLDEVRAMEEELRGAGPDTAIMARAALASYADAGGGALAFVGGRGSTADGGFFDALESLDVSVRRPHRGWAGIDEELVVAFISR